MSNRIPTVNIADIKNRIKEVQNSRGGGGSHSYNEKYFPFFLMDAGDEAVVRILPDIDTNNPNFWYVERYNHKLMIDGKKYNVVCPTTYERGAECPICERCDAYYKAGDKEKGVAHWKGKPVANLQVLVLEHGTIKDKEGKELDFTGKVCQVSFTTQVLNAILERLTSFDDDDPAFCGIPEGFNFVLKSSMNGDNKVWSFSDFERRPSVLPENLVAVVEDSLEPYESLLPARPSVEKLQHMLDAADGIVDLDLKQFSENASSSDEESAPKAERTQAAAPAPVPEPVKETVAPVQDDEPPFTPDEEETPSLVAELSADDDDDNDLIAGILSR